MLAVSAKEGKYLTLAMALPAGNEYNVKPELVVEAMEKYIEGFDVVFVQCHRTALLCDGKEFI